VVVQVITIIDYGVGNTGSLINMARKAGVKSVVSRDADAIIKAERIILPGVGAFDAAIGKLHALGLVEPIREAAKRGTPILGVCLGMQILTKCSEEGQCEGLGLVDAAVKRFDLGKPQMSGCKVPHMGWNDVEVVKPHPLFQGLEQNSRFYFVHSYHVVSARAEDVVGTTRYGVEFTSSYAVGNVCGVQFHPEKSHRYGLELLKNFAEM
jgi:glutamine amidotransferase